MKKIGAILVTVFSFAVFGMDADCNSSVDRFTDDNSKNRMEQLYSCGEGSESGFNGWMINGVSDAVNIYFENKQIEFFSHQANNFDISFTKRLDQLVGFSDLNIAFDFDAVENCELNHATVYLSEDGKHWNPINKDAKNGAVTNYSEKMNLLYLKLVTNVSFYNEGRFKLRSASVMGDYTLGRNNPPKEFGLATKGPAAVQLKQIFRVFSFEKRINIETQNDEEYRFVLYDTKGRIVKEDVGMGSKRFETPYKDGVYFVSIIQNNKLIITKKVAL
ncbi:MAG: hypothetical protein ACI857_000768 [Arenicella sp.]|jgi:hypothetical protein